MRAARQPNHVLHRPAPTERGPAQAQRVRHEEALRVGLMPTAPEAVIHGGARGSGGGGAAVESAGRRADQRRQWRRRDDDGRRWRRRWAQRQTRADVYLRRRHRRHGPAGQPTGRPRLYRRLHHFVQ